MKPLFTIITPLFFSSVNLPPSSRIEKWRVKGKGLPLGEGRKVVVNDVWMTHGATIVGRRLLLSETLGEGPPLRPDF